MAEQQHKTIHIQAALLGTQIQGQQTMNNAQTQAMLKQQHKKRMLIQVGLLGTLVQKQQRL